MLFCNFPTSSSVGFLTSFGGKCLFPLDGVGKLDDILRWNPETELAVWPLVVLGWPGAVGFMGLFFPSQPLLLGLHLGQLAAVERVSKGQVLALIHHLSQIFVDNGTLGSNWLQNSEGGWTPRLVLPATAVWSCAGSILSKHHLQGHVIGHDLLVPFQALLRLRDLVHTINPVLASHIKVAAWRHVLGSKPQRAPSTLSSLLSGCLLHSQCAFSLGTGALWCGFTWGVASPLGCWLTLLCLIVNIYYRGAAKQVNVHAIIQHAALKPKAQSL